VDDYATFNKAMFGSQSFTAMQWAKYTGASNAICVGLGQYISGAIGRLLIHYHNNDGTISFNVGGSAPNISIVEILNTWYCIAIVRIASVYIMYVNGDYVGQSVDTDVIYTETSTTIGGTLSGLHWIGQLNNVCIYNRALSANEVRQNFNATRGRYGI
jgi:hypothetical protein